MDRVTIQWRFFIIVCVVVLGLFGWGFWRNHVDRQNATASESTLQTKLTQLHNEDVNLNAELQLIGTTSYIENRAREDYAFLKPGEMRFEIVNPECLKGYTESEWLILTQELVY